VSATETRPVDAGPAIDWLLSSAEPAVTYLTRRDVLAKDLADRTGILAGPKVTALLEHRLFRSLEKGEVIHRDWVVLHFPPYWHYDVLQALLVLSRLGSLADSRADEALELVIRRRRADGLWQAGGYWWRRPGSATLVEAVDWGRGGPNEMITLNALRVLRAAGLLRAT
jgi:hypothetical protein